MYVITLYNDSYEELEEVLEEVEVLGVVKIESDTRLPVHVTVDEYGQLYLQN